ncbi:hypothetical protein Sjap_008101 [Stephania japonica]|uniref:Uncharacterized protein n=1 Tax=Stephania japonica TaxID=461633 RepID=A0AAP0JR77_9MAGN
MRARSLNYQQEEKCVFEVDKSFLSRLRKSQNSQRNFTELLEEKVMTFESKHRLLVKDGFIMDLIHSQALSA